MEPIISTPILYVAWFATIALGVFLWNLAPHQAAEMGEFLTYFASVATAVFFVFFLTPLAVQSGLTALFYSTYGAIMISALVGTFYTLALDRGDHHRLEERIEDDPYY